MKESEEPWSDRLPADEESPIKVWEALRLQAKQVCRLANRRIMELKRETHATGEASEHKAE